jgi:hypothetical protein
LRTFSRTRGTKEEKMELGEKEKRRKKEELRKRRAIKEKLKYWVEKGRR